MLKKWKWSSKEKISYFNHSTNKNEDFYVYDYVEHLKRFGFLWTNTNLGLVYEITIVGNKLRKQLTMSRNERKKIAIDESRTWNMSNISATDKSRISYSDSYIYFENRLKTEFNINGDSFDFRKLSKREKTSNIINYFKKNHDQKHSFKGYPYLFSFYPFSYASVIFVINNIFIVYPDRIQRIFVPKYYHDRRTTNFLRNLKFVS